MRPARSIRPLLIALALIGSCAKDKTTALDIELVSVTGGIDQIRIEEVTLNTVAISHLRYIPSVSGAEEAVQMAAPEMKAAKMLSADTDLVELTKRAFVHLDGVSDEWLKTLQVEKVAGGQVPPDEDIRLYAELIQSDTEDSCCKKKMYDQPDQDQAPARLDPQAAKKTSVAASR